MPFIYNNEDEQKKNQGQNGSTNISGPQSVINQPAQSVSAPKPVQRSGSWTNLNAYLDANKEQATSMGSTIADKISNQGTTTRGNINSATEDFNLRVNDGTIQGLDEANQDVNSIVGKARTSNSTSQINDDDVNRFKTIATAAYSGPNSLSESDRYQDAQKSFDKAQQYKQDAYSDAGRYNLLQETYNRPTYSQGQKSLDNLFIQGNQQAKTNIKNSADSLADLQGMWSTANQDAATLSSQRASDINAARKYAQDTLSSNRNARSSEVDAGLSDIQSKWSDEYDAMNQVLDGYGTGDLEVTQDQYNKLGLLGANGQQIFNLLNGVPASTYLDLAGYDENKVISKDQFAQLAALDRLANQYGGVSSSRFNNADAAGTLGLNNNFKADRFGRAALEARNAFTDYAGGASFSGYGSNTQTYQDGPFDKDEVTRTATMQANLADVLRQAGYDISNIPLRETEEPGGGVINTDNPIDTGLDLTDPLSSLPAGAINDILSHQSGDIAGAVGDVANAIGLGGGDDSEAKRAAQYWANEQARNSLINQIQAALAAQGFSNRVKIKG